jgi:hypothetical protein
MLGMVITLSNDAAWSMETEMIEVYAFATPNSVKAPIPPGGDAPRLRESIAARPAVQRAIARVEALVAVA